MHPTMQGASRGDAIRAARAPFASARSRKPLRPNAGDLRLVLFNLGKRPSKPQSSLEEPAAERDGQPGRRESVSPEKTEGPIASKSR